MILLFDIVFVIFCFFFFFSSRRRHTRCSRDWSSDVCSSDLVHGALNCSRFPCCTQSPPVNWFRTMNGPADVWFTIAIPGCSFHVPVNSDGRLMPVCQSTCVLKVR